MDDDSVYLDYIELKNEADLMKSIKNAQKIKIKRWGNFYDGYPHGIETWWYEKPGRKQRSWDVYCFFDYIVDDYKRRIDKAYIPHEAMFNKIMATNDLLSVTIVEWDGVIKYMSTFEIVS